MKFPKNRANVYVVVREDCDVWAAQLINASILGVFQDLVEADNFCGACQSEFFEKAPNAPTKFEVRLSTFYG